MFITSASTTPESPTDNETRAYLSFEADELRVADVVRLVLPEAPLERVELGVVDLEVLGAVLGDRLLLRQADRAVLERREHRRGHRVVLGLRAGTKEREMQSDSTRTSIPDKERAWIGTKDNVIYMIYTTRIPIQEMHEMSGSQKGIKLRIWSEQETSANMHNKEILSTRA